MMMPYDDFLYLINSILLGEEPVSGGTDTVVVANCQQS